MEGPMRRVASDEFLAEGCLPASEPFWLDYVLYDIPLTVEAGIRSAAASGAKAITLYEPLVLVDTYEKAIDAAKSLGLMIYVARRGDYERSMWWNPHVEKEA
jgi:orotidine-5'-phosphate decarboxylase